MHVRLYGCALEHIMSDRRDCTAGMLNKQCEVVGKTRRPTAAYLLTMALPDARLTISRSVCMSSLT